MVLFHEEGKSQLLRCAKPLIDCLEKKRPAVDARANHWQVKKKLSKFYENLVNQNQNQYLSHKQTQHFTLFLPSVGVILVFSSPSSSSPKPPARNPPGPSPPVRLSAPGDYVRVLALAPVVPTFRFLFAGHPARHSWGWYFVSMKFFDWYRKKNPTEVCRFSFRTHPCAPISG